MVEVVFSESAKGSLKVAQHYGEGPYHGNVAVAACGDGPDMPQSARERAERAALERVRWEWEQAVPMGGSAKDVLGIDLGWSIGRISEDGIGEERRQVLEQQFAVWSPADAAEMAEESIRNNQKALDEILQRSADGDSVRIWYSHNPDEMCGLYWMLAQIQKLPEHGEVSMVRLPDWEINVDGDVFIPISWGEISPGEWGKHLSRQEKVSPALLSGCAMRWRQLQEENADLRVVLNGRLQSAPADLYDSFILRELEAQPKECNEAQAIGNVLGKYHLGIGDGWVALRIQAFIRKGMYEVISPAAPDQPVYRQKLRRLYDV